MNYNETIKWLLANDRNPLCVIGSDKLKVKEYVAEKLGSSEYTPKVLAVGDSVHDCYDNFLNRIPPKNYVLKANNDSGGVMIVKDKVIVKGNMHRLEKHKTVPYGQAKGEWFYAEIPFKVFAEEFLKDDIIDYKWHCSNGTPKFCQVIKDRNTVTNEICLMPDGDIIPEHFDTNFARSKYFLKPESWYKQIEIATKLCKDFRYVRVDLFSIKDKVYVGELTFAPRAGNYPYNEAIERLGKMLDINS